MFSYVLGRGWLQAGWLGRLAGIPVLTSKKQVLHKFFMVLPKKPPKTCCFHTFSEAGGSGLAGSAGWLNTRFDLQRASITLVLHGFTPKNCKNLMFSYVFGSLEMQDFTI